MADHSRLASFPPNLLACPACRTALVPPHPVCLTCGTSYCSDDGILIFNDRGLYHGPILPRREMDQFLSLAETDGYRRAIETYLARHDPELASYVLAPERVRGLSAIPIRPEDRVLDFGCGFGTLARALVHRADLVVALDATRAKVRFLDIIRRQEPLERLLPICSGDPLQLPFVDAAFDLVVLNAVFEYLPQSVPVADPSRAHLLALREFRRVLKPGGVLFLATKNRFSYLYFLGAKDHHGLRFTSLLPRALADHLTRRTRSLPYRVVTHSLYRYRALLREADFEPLAAYWPVPSLQYPNALIPLTAKRFDMLRRLRSLKPPHRLKSIPWWVLAVCGLLHWFVPHYVIVASARPSRP